MNETLERPKTGSPLEAYRRLLTRNWERLAYQQRWDRRLGYAKVAVGLLLLGLMIWYVHELHGSRLLLIPVAAFVVLAIAHDQVLRRIQEIKAVIAHYERGLARLEGRWTGKGEGGERFVDAAHPYARDLDVFGAGSIFELLCTFRTRAGEETLARWLLEAAAPDEIRARQRAAEELRTRVEFRERLFTAGDKVRLGVHPDSLAAWGEEKSSAVSRWLPVLSAALAILWAASIPYGIMRDSYLPLLLLSPVNLMVNRLVMKRFRVSAEAMEGLRTIWICSRRFCGFWNRNSLSRHG